MTEYFFKFTIPEEIRSGNGETPKIPPNWCGEMTFPPDPAQTKALMHNDRDGWGVGMTTDDTIATKSKGDFELISKEEALDLIKQAGVVSPVTSGEVTAAKVEDVGVTIDGEKGLVFSHREAIPLELAEGVYAGDKLAHRWDAKPEQTETIIGEDGLPKVVPRPRRVIDTQATTCKKCHKLSAVISLNSDSTVKITCGGKTLIDGISISTDKVPNIYISCPSGHSINALTGELKPKDKPKETVKA
jgi:hypothetical protein